MCCRASSRAVFQIRSDLIGSEIDKRERSVLLDGLSRLAWICLAFLKIRHTRFEMLPKFLLSLFLSFSLSLRNFLAEKFCHKKRREYDDQTVAKY